ncbi:MAG: HAD family hydrolase [Candidatus Babeliales bacterium]
MNIFLLIISIIALFILLYTIHHCFSCPVTMLKKNNKKVHSSPVFVFDLHGVILNRKYGGILKYILKHAYRLDVALLLFKPSFIKDIVALLKKSRVPEEFIIELSQKHSKLVPFIDVTIAMMNEQKPVKGTIDCIKKLKEHGYKVYLFSNIGEKTFEQLEKKFPVLFSYFNGIVVVQQHDNWIQKPSAASFQKFLKQSHLQAEQCVFIDNSTKNVTTAFYEGFHPILFRSPAQLMHELVHLNILR